MNCKVYNDGINKSCKSQLNEENSNNRTTLLAFSWDKRK